MNCHVFRGKVTLRLHARALFLWEALVWPLA